MLAAHPEDGALIEELRTLMFALVMGTAGAGYPFDVLLAQVSCCHGCTSRKSPPKPERAGRASAAERPGACSFGQLIWVLGALSQVQLVPKMVSCTMADAAHGILAYTCVLPAGVPPEQPTSR